jgi:hypothetical protein
MFINEMFYNTAMIIWLEIACGRVESLWQRLYWPQGLKYLLSGLFRESAEWGTIKIVTTRQGMLRNPFSYFYLFNMLLKIKIMAVGCGF